MLYITYSKDETPRVGVTHSALSPATRWTTGVQFLVGGKITFECWSGSAVLVLRSYVLPNPSVVSKDNPGPLPVTHSLDVTQLKQTVK